MLKRLRFIDARFLLLIISVHLFACCNNLYLYLNQKLEVYYAHL